MPRAVSKFITHHPWAVSHVIGSDQVSLQHTVNARGVDIRWSLVPTTGSNFVGASRGTIPFTISIEDKLTPQGLIFRCATKKGATYRYVVERVSCYATFAERDSFSSYYGPRFDTLEPTLQEAFDEVLHEWGMGGEVVDFIEASSQYYNNVEYVNWLCNINDFISK